MSVNSAAGLIVRLNRVNPRLSTVSPNVARRAENVEMSALGELPESTRLKSGAVPAVVRNCSVLLPLLVPHPVAGE